MNVARLPDSHFIEADVARALQEDIGSGDVSAALVADSPARARIVCNEAAVLCGQAWAERSFRSLDPNIEISWRLKDGDQVAAGALLCELRGRARALLGAERTALNFLQTLSGTASTAARFAAALGAAKTRILDTRKTLPGLRRAQKYAVTCGGCCNHRFGLYDAVMLKENHITAAGSIASALQAARTRFPDLPLIVEVESLDELHQLLAAGGADRALLDDFSLADVYEAVRCSNGRLPLEISGGVELERLADFAATGVDFISIGALTKHLRAIDMSMRFCER